MSKLPPNFSEELVKRMNESDSEFIAVKSTRLSPIVTYNISIVLGVGASIICFLGLCMSGLLIYPLAIIGFIMFLLISPPETSSSTTNFTPQPHYTITPTPIVIIHYDENNPHPIHIPCSITALNNYAAIIYAQPNRADQIGWFELGDRLKVVGTANRKWYEVELEDGTLGWFYSMDTSYTSDYDTASNCSDP